MGFLIILAFILVNYIKIRAEIPERSYKLFNRKWRENANVFKKIQKKYWHFWKKILKCKKLEK